MSIPKYKDLMLPLLKSIADGQVHIFRDVINSLANEFFLSNEEKEELLPSGSARVFDNRVGWANFYLKKSGLVKSEKRGTLPIVRRSPSANCWRWPMYPWMNWAAGLWVIPKC